MTNIRSRIEFYPDYGADSTMRGSGLSKWIGENACVSCEHKGCERPTVQSGNVVAFADNSVVCHEGTLPCETALKPQRVKVRRRAAKVDPSLK